MKNVFVIIQKNYNVRWRVYPAAAIVRAAIEHL